MADISLDPLNPPPPLSTGEPGSFAHNTLVTRKPAVLRQVLADYPYPATIVQNIESLIEEIVEDRAIAPLQTTAPDGPDWLAAWREVEGRTWLQAPWYWVEAFLYRRLLEAANYFGGHGADLQAWVGVDPFWPRKQEELAGDAPWQVLVTALRHSTGNSVDGLQSLLHYAVWGNRVDLSYNQVAESAGRDIALERERENLLVDDTEPVLAHLNPGPLAMNNEQLTTPSRHPSNPPGQSAISNKQSTNPILHPFGSAQSRASSLPILRLRSGQVFQPSNLPTFHSSIHFICDNTGAELLLDLALADFLLRFDRARQIVLQVKAHPTYVSDATPDDVERTIAAIRRRGGVAFGALAERLAGFVMANRLRLNADLFWNSSRFFWDMPAGLHAQLAQAELVVIKGDANYRRLVGDHRWPATTPLANVAHYFPAPFVCLRTLKSDPIVGLPPGQAERLDQEDPEWRVNGKRGVIQALV
jgi:uncharacterized protein with ATP-grasp and redox domains